MVDGFGAGGFASGLTSGVQAGAAATNPIMQAALQRREEQFRTEQGALDRQSRIDMFKAQLSAEQQEQFRQEAVANLNDLIGNIQEVTRTAGPEAAIAAAERMRQAGLFDSLSDRMNVGGVPGFSGDQLFQEAITRGQAVATAEQQAQAGAQARIAEAEAVSEATGAPLQRALGVEAPIMTLGPGQVATQEGRVIATGGPSQRLMQAMTPEGQIVFASPEEIRVGGFTPIPRAADEITVPTEQGPVTIRRGGTPQTGTQPVSAGGTSGGVPAIAQPISQESQEQISQGFNTLRMLDILEENVGETGLLTGVASRLGVALGTDPGAIDFQTARNQLVLQAQALIAGIPSNYDVQLYERTVPQLIAPESVNRRKISTARDITKELIKDTIAFNKFTNRRIPDEIMKQAREFNIDPDKVESYGGQGDPLQNSIDKSMQALTTEELIGIDETSLAPDLARQLLDELKTRRKNG